MILVKQAFGNQEYLKDLFLFPLQSRGGGAGNEILFSSCTLKCPECIDLRGWDLWIIFSSHAICLFIFAVTMSSLKKHQLAWKFCMIGNFVWIMHLHTLHFLIDVKTWGLQKGHNICCYNIYDSYLLEGMHYFYITAPSWCSSLLY